MRIENYTVHSVNILVLFCFSTVSVAAKEIGTSVKLAQSSENLTHLLDASREITQPAKFSKLLLRRAHIAARKRNKFLKRLKSHRRRIRSSRFEILDKFLKSVINDTTHDDGRGLWDDLSNEYHNQSMAHGANHTEASSEYDQPRARAFIIFGAIWLIVFILVTLFSVFGSKNLRANKPASPPLPSNGPSRGSLYRVGGPRPSRTASIAHPQPPDGAPPVRGIIKNSGSKRYSMMSDPVDLEIVSSTSSVFTNKLRAQPGPSFIQGTGSSRYKAQLKKSIKRFLNA